MSNSAPRPEPRQTAAPSSFADGYARSLSVLRHDFDYTIGYVSMPLQLPPDSLLLWCVTQTNQDFTGGSGDCQVSLGTAAGRIDILGPDGVGGFRNVAVRPITGALPSPPDPNPDQVFVNIDARGCTQGKATLALVYTRP